MEGSAPRKRGLPALLPGQCGGGHVRAAPGVTSRGGSGTLVPLDG